MRNILKTANKNQCCQSCHKIEIFVPSIEKETLESIIAFFYEGNIKFSNSEKRDRFLENVTKIFGVSVDQLMYQNEEISSFKEDFEMEVPITIENEFGTIETMTIPSTTQKENNHKANVMVRISV